MDTRLGTALEGRYTIDHEIGVGGMATVYLAHGSFELARLCLAVVELECYHEQASRSLVRRLSHYHACPPPRRKM